MENTRDFFLQITQRIFSNWTALRMAVEHGMGSKDKAIEFCPYITEVIYMNENLSSDEVAGELEEYMDTEFNTELQDNSAIEVAQQLLRFYQYCLNSDEKTAMAEMEKLPALKSWILSRDMIRKQISDGPSTSEVSNGGEEDEMSEHVKETAVEDEWLEVKPRKKK
ncbi:uncharacterized protein [Chelonus insularis]|uniref:uncharacterized protein n=1 Tax=Chelonus insularis TaxID=460826 RepID=UPI00158DCF49|nr:uncharacterized protein LOC118064724 [Chelonus insularis]XP_034935427.1 uncharacterized protein LOC118064724 [Chelonus insularis]